MGIGGSVVFEDVVNEICSLMMIELIDYYFGVVGISHE